MTQRLTSNVQSSSQPLLERRRATPVKWWAALGAGFLLFQSYLYARWILAGNFQPTPSGPDPVPGYMEVAGHIYEILGPLLMVGFFYAYLVRPWRRERRVSLEGAMCLAALTCAWQSTAANWSVNTVTWNATLHNWGAWYNFIPGWLAPRGNFIADPLLVEVPFFVPYIFGIPLFVRWCMRKASTIRPELGTAGLIGVAVVAAMIVDFVIEMVWLRTGLYVYAGTIPSLTFFEGHYYQFPIYEALLVAPTLAAVSCLLYFLDDKGRSVVERGADRLRVSTRQSAVLRVLALAAFLNVALVLYNLAWGLVSLQPSLSWAGDVVHRSYLRNELCGPGTGYACSAEDIPLPRDNGPHVTPDGVFVR